MHPVCGPPVPAASSGLQVVELEKPLPGTVGVACPPTPSSPHPCCWRQRRPPESWLGDHAFEWQWALGGVILVRPKGESIRNYQSPDHRTYMATKNEAEWGGKEAERPSPLLGSVPAWRRSRMWPIGLAPSRPPGGLAGPPAAPQLGLWPLPPPRPRQALRQATGSPDAGVSCAPRPWGLAADRLSRSGFSLDVLPSGRRSREGSSSVVWKACVRPAASCGLERPLTAVSVPVRR